MIERMSGFEDFEKTRKHKILNLIAIIISIVSIILGVFGFTFTPFKFGSIEFLVLGSMRILKPIFFRRNLKRQYSQNIRNEDSGLVNHK